MNTEPPESAVATPIDLNRLVAFVLASSTKAKPIVTPKEIESAKAICAEWVKLSPVLQGNPDAEGKAEFLRQQQSIGRGENRQDAFEKHEFQREARLRIAAGKGRMRELTSEASKIGDGIVGRFLPLLAEATKGIEAEHLALYEKTGVGTYEQPLLLRCLADVPRRLDFMMPSEGGCCSPASFLSVFIDGLPTPPAVISPEAQRLAAKLALEAKRAQDTQTGHVNEAEQRRKAAAFEAKEERKRQLAAAGIIKLANVPKL